MKPKKLNIYFDEKRKNLFYKDNNNKLHSLIDNQNNTSEYEKNPEKIYKQDDLQIIQTKSKLFLYHHIGFNKTESIKINSGLNLIKIFLSIESKKNQSIYVFLKKDTIIPNSLKKFDIYNNLPNNLNYEFYLDNKKSNNFNFGIISNYPIKTNSYLNIKNFY